MADFDLTQTDQQVQNILNDGQSAMGAGAQTTLTTEYVMLKDTNGVYHKILKSSFTEAIRDVLAGTLNACGVTIVEKDADDLPVPSFYTDEHVNILSELLDF